ncbi:MAG: DUF4293 domain-containing protein [Bacteroidales bacterium]|jgi:hypothetical protein|nr:DUF4293 domain-containing protein [Bacteroidales bacterium]
MIQRIQSIFLFASLCFLLPLFFVPVVTLLSTNGDIFVFNLTGFYETGIDGTQYLSRQNSLLVFGILICALNLITIFMYKRRLLQIRLCIYNILLLIGLIGVAIFVLRGVQQIGSFTYHLPVVFPVVSIILHYLAYRGIRKDELMVQALSRLR